jgi:Flp pilus assembly protein TadG
MVSARARVNVPWRALRGLARDQRGGALVETALTLPVMLTVMLGIISFATAFANYLGLTNGTAMAAQALSISRGQSLDPCKTAYNAFELGASTLQTSGLTFQILINSSPNGGTSSTLYTIWNGAKGTAPTCSSTSLTSGYPADLVAGNVASVTVTYPCNLVVYGHNFAPNCTLTAQTSEVIQ